ncbi:MULTISPECIES: response regulator transcription factor [unclassified Streptomyces]|uniref:response regulator transcription factor n=1 Tax=unclassified Streptomyces TaxID=2593676 RepID=UPI001903A620|nr:MULTISPECIES: response regulator transcription factor [unclassified Streptomyces]MCU4745393.1 response regulator transcription factor [Streptomyces sp. G-5]QQN79597.1 response regulator transcription factor [Streptomyces sp. XC 2026]
MTTADTVLVVEDDASIRDLLASALGFVGFDVRLADDVPQALTSLERETPDAIVLDVGLPGGSGFDVLHLLRSRGLSVPVMFLTARDAIEDRVRGFHLGGDDYVVKPFSVVEVGARLEALIRRSRGTTGRSPNDGVLRHAGLELDDKRHTVHRDGEAIDLSPTEFRLLRYLLSHAEHVMTRSQILEAVWQYDFGGDSVVVERFVSNLRRKIDHERLPLIHTVRGVGYSLREPPA